MLQKKSCVTTSCAISHVILLVIFSLSATMASLCRADAAADPAAAPTTPQASGATSSTLTDSSASAAPVTSTTTNEPHAEAPAATSATPSMTAADVDNHSSHLSASVECSSVQNELTKMIKDYAYGHIFFAQRLIKRCPQLQNGQFPPNVEDCADNDRDKEKIRNEKHKIEVDLVAEYGRPRVAQCTANFLGNDEL